MAGTLSRAFHLVALILYAIMEILIANVRVAIDVVTPRHRMRPGVIAVPLDLKNDAEITLLANLITLTPGSLSLDVSSDRKVLYVHEMYIEDLDSIRQDLKDKFERRIARVMH